MDRYLDRLRTYLDDYEGTASLPAVRLAERVIVSPSLRLLVCPRRSSRR
jgi:hypothetical protein